MKPQPLIRNKSITGFAGKLTLTEEGSVLQLSKAVDNAWAAPGANGCGGMFSFILDPIINAAAGLPATAGKTPRS